MSTVVAASRTADLGASAQASLEAMADTLASEARLLDELGAVLRRQRDAVARDDLAQVEDAVYSMHRILMTLGEARRRRRSLDQLLGAREVDPRTGPLSAAYERVHQAALDLADELEVSRDLLRRALDGGDAQIRALQSGARATLFYDQSAAASPVGEGPEGALLRRRA